MACNIGGTYPTTHSLVLLHSCRRGGIRRYEGNSLRVGSKTVSSASRRHHVSRGFIE